MGLFSMVVGIEEYYLKDVDRMRREMSAMKSRIQ